MKLKVSASKPDVHPYLKEAKDINEDMKFWQEEVLQKLQEYKKKLPEKLEHYLLLRSLFSCIVSSKQVLKDITLLTSCSKERELLSLLSPLG